MAEYFFVVNKMSLQHLLVLLLELLQVYVSESNIKEVRTVGSRLIVLDRKQNSL